MKNPNQKIKTIDERPKPQFDLFRLSRSKELVDLVPNTLRTYNTLGLPFYRMGKVVFISKSELEAFIRKGVTAQPKKK